jgi:hypothetical protein
LASNKKNLYISARNAKVWEEFDQYAEQVGMSASELVPLALQYFMDHIAQVGPRSLVERRVTRGR